MVQPFTQKTPNYSLGTVTVANGASVANFTGANLVATDSTTGIVSTVVCVGDIFNIPGVGSRVISAVDPGGAQVSLADPWTPATQTGVAYQIYRYSTPLQGVALAAANAAITQGQDSNPVASEAVDDGTARVKLKVASGVPSLAVGATGAADGALVNAIQIDKTSGVVSHPSGQLFGQTPARRNRIINGNFDVWQRGTSISVANNVTIYTADRMLVQNGSAGVTATVSKVSAPSGFRGQYALNIAATGVVATGYFDVQHRFESQMIFDLDGQAATVSFDMNASTSAGTLTGTIYSYANTALDNGTFGTYLFATPFTVPVGSGKVTVPITAAQTVGMKYGCMLGVRITQNTSTGNVNINHGSLQLELGTVAQPFEKYALGEELALCQRYFCKSYKQGDAPGTVTMVGVGATNNWNSYTFYRGAISFPVPMRAVPTVTLYNHSTGASGTWHFVTANTNVSASISAGESAFEATGGTWPSSVDYTYPHFTASAEL